MPAKFTSILLQCVYCRGGFMMPPSRANQQFCSAACRRAAHRDFDWLISNRFWQHVDTSGECWPWTGTSDGGYGLFRIGGKYYRAARIVCEMVHGCMSPGTDTCHTCDNPPCVRPAHLFPGSRLLNVHDARDKGRLSKGGGLPHGTNNRFANPGESNPRARLTAAQVQSIRDEYANGGISQKAIASRYGVARSTIGYVVSGETWREPSESMPLEIAGNQATIK